MEKKPENLFDKLDKQEEQINDLKSKIVVDTEKLYSLALRCFNLGDYKNAMHHFNHLSLLSPNDLKAPFYAYLCTISGSRHYSEYVNMVEDVKEVFIKYLEEVNSKNPDELSFFVNLIDEYYKKICKSYFKGKKEYNKIDANYAWHLQEAMNSIISKIQSFKVEESMFESISINIDKLEELTQSNEVPLIEHKPINEVALINEKEEKFSFGTSYIINKASTKTVYTINFTCLLALLIFSCSLSSLLFKYSFFCSLLYILIVIYSVFLIIIYGINYFREKILRKGKLNIRIIAFKSNFFNRLLRSEKNINEVCLWIDFILIPLIIVIGIINIVVILVSKIYVEEVFTLIFESTILAIALAYHLVSVYSLLEKQNKV